VPEFAEVQITEHISVSSTAGRPAKPCGDADAFAAAIGSSPRRDLKREADLLLHPYSLVLTPDMAKREDMACAWATALSDGRRPASWSIYDQMRPQGIAGILVPSFAPRAGAEDRNLVLWGWGPDLPYKVHVLDPSGRLPKDQPSGDETLAEGKGRFGRRRQRQPRAGATWVRTDDMGMG
jgi:hypothetical protein